MNSHPRAAVFVSLLVLAGCGGAESRADAPDADGGAAGEASTSTAGGAGGGLGGTGSGGDGGETPPLCDEVDDQAELLLGTAPSSDELRLDLPATTASRTRWSELGNEAVILEVRVGGALRGHLVLHHGHDGGTYSMALGAVEEGEPITVRVSEHSAPLAMRSACVGPASLTGASELPQPQGLRRAPVIKWPLQKRFDDLPVVLGWSKEKRTYHVVYTNENGGTVEQCGGGAEGIRAEIARWGRAVDIERAYRYGDGASWNRCTGSTDFTAHPVQMEADHPIFYYGDGHNRLFESRGGYGATCGGGGAEKADGDLVGFNVDNPGNDPSLDDDLVLTVRLAPVSLDDLGYADWSGRREALVDRYAPWAYRLLDSELAREGKIDGAMALPMEQYAYADVYAADVGGSGDSYCSFLGVGSGFKLRLTAGGETMSSAQMTSDYFGGDVNVKRLAVPLPSALGSSAFTSVVFDAYDDDGMYWLALGEVFIPRPVGDNGAFIDSIVAANTDLNVYVDDDSSGCSAGENGDGPAGPAPCVGGQYTLDLGN